MAFITYINSICDDQLKDEDEDSAPQLQQLQQTLFPAIQTPSCISAPGGFFMNLVLKPTPAVTEVDSTELLIKKDSKELFAVIRDPSATIQPPRWPTECQVLDENIKHILYTPPVPEPYYIRTGKEVQPKPVGDELGIIIYQYYPISAVNYFSRSSIGGSRYLLPTCPAPEEDSLRFESRFESGNLAKAIKITAIYYELYIRTDLYTNKHMQWYYFRVTNMKKHMTYRFSIVNMTKEDSLYNEGMKPLLYSTKDAQLHNIGWRRCGSNITYYSNEDPETGDPDQVPTYTLTFTLDFPHEGDMVYLAYSYPYTYSDLQNHLLEISKHPIKSTYTTLRLLCRTLAGNNLYYVTITAPQESKDKEKQAVIITARVHPGETPASWIMKGMIDFLTSDSAPAKELRKKFIFKLVPMLNPDGVIVGNNRCSMAGTDLNRQYRTVIRETYPAVWYTKIMIRRMVEECGVAMYVDVHAHSRKHNIFLYGCENKRIAERRLYEQVFPLMLHKNTADKFSFKDCNFRIQRCKEGTARVAMWMMGIANSYTMESSFAGSTIGAKNETHFSAQDYEQMGRSFCQTLLDFYDEDPRKERLRLKIIERLMCQGSNADEPTNIPLSDYSSDDGESSYSDEVSRADYIPPLLLRPPPPTPIAARKVHKNRPTAAKVTKTVCKTQNVTIQQRSTFQISRTTLDFSKVSKAKYTSYSSSDSDSETPTYKKKAVKKKRTKKRNKKRPSLQPKQSDTEDARSPPRSLSVMELLLSSKLRAESWNSSLAPPKHLIDNRNVRTTSQELAEVQAKLITLKNRLWYGSGEGDVNIPISWAKSKFSENQAGNKKGQVKKSSKSGAKSEKVELPIRSDKKNKKEETKEKEKTGKKKTQPKRPITVQWLPAEDFTRIIDSSYKKEKKGGRNADNEEEWKTVVASSKKNKKKMQKNATLVSNVNVFMKKD